MLPDEEGASPGANQGQHRQESLQGTRPVRLPGGGEAEVHPGDEQFRWAVWRSSIGHPGYSDAPGAETPFEAIETAKEGLGTPFAGVSLPEATQLWQAGRFYRLFAEHLLQIKREMNL